MILSRDELTALIQIVERCPMTMAEQLFMGQLLRRLSDELAHEANKETTPEESSP